MFFIYRRCTPPDRLYGITDRSISVDHGLYGPIGVGCMALQTIRSVFIAVYQCNGIPMLQIPTYREPQGKNVFKVRAFLVRCAYNQVVGT